MFVHKKWPTMLTITIAALFLVACGVQEEGQVETDIHPLNEVYEQSCAACHGDDLSGDIGPSLIGIGKRLSKEEIKDIAENGVGNMPADLATAEDAQIVAEWLSETQQ